jgi:pimeloyl-ACP methyl ester carboxylesterase
MTISRHSLGLCYEAIFDAQPLPFQITMEDEFLQRTLQKVYLTRFVEDEVDQPPFTDGPPTITSRSLAEYWTGTYDWRSVEASLNSTLQQFTVLVSPSQSPANYVDEIPLHFVHHKSTRKDAIPLLFVHGWPGSFIEVAPMINRLTDPPDPSLPAFHVVAPSIPGFGFSPSPRKPGMGYRAVAATFHALMAEKLGYSRYVFQGGDAGDLINRYMAHDFPDSIVSGHSNFWVVPPTNAELETYRRQQFPADSDEYYFCEHWTGFFETGWGYAQIQQTRPLKLAQGLTDSPVGLAMWIYDSVAMGIEPDRRDEVWPLDRVITWTMMHWLNGPYGAFSLYKQGAKVCHRSGLQLPNGQQFLLIAHCEVY